MSFIHKKKILTIATNSFIFLYGINKAKVQRALSTYTLFNNTSFNYKCEFSYHFKFPRKLLLRLCVHTYICQYTYNIDVNGNRVIKMKAFN